MLVGACGGGSQGHAPGPRALKHASTVTAATGLRMSIQLRSPAAAPSVVFSATGSFMPSKGEGTMLMDMQAPSSGEAPMPMRVVIANGTIYEQLPPELASRIPGGRPWLSLKVSQLGALSQLPGLFPFIKESLLFADPGQYLDFVSAAGAGSVKGLGNATVGGVQATRYRTTIDISKLPSAAPSADRPAAAELANQLKSQMRGSTIPIEVWVDRANLVRRLQTAWTGNAQSGAAVAMTVNIDRYGSQPAPSVPSAAETTPLLSLVQAFHPSSG